MPFNPVNHSLGIPFVELPSVDSTNNYALNQIRANLAQPGTCYFAHEQTAGKGQRGKSWSSEKDANITLSIVLKPTFLQLFQQFELNACISLGTLLFFAEFVSSGLAIKWPNDLYWQDRKLGGILIENVIGSGRTFNAGPELENETIKESPSRWEWAVAGVGLNINQTSFPNILKNPVSLKQITGRAFDVRALAKKLCRKIDQQYHQLLHHGADVIIKSYNEVLYKRDETVKFKKDNRNFQAQVKSVDKAGQLVIQHGVEEKIDFGHVEWVME